tara:strand:- start:6423 stop:7187 length:765 start_codon:yes stop_codon:yes gene_type:complete
MENSEIISNKNKYKLWDEFNSKGYFNNVVDHEFENVQQLFEKSINYINEKYKKQKNLPIDKVNDEIETVFKKNMLIFNEQKRANKIEDHRMKNMTQLMKNKENEMNEILNPVKPKEIDFQNENNDEPFKENVEEMINKTIEERQKELSSIIESIPKPPQIELQENLENEIIDEKNFLLPEPIVKNQEMEKEIIKSQIKIIELLENINNDNKTIISSLQSINDNNEIIHILHDIQNNIKSQKIKKQKQVTNKNKI